MAHLNAFLNLEEAHIDFIAHCLLFFVGVPRQSTGSTYAQHLPFTGNIRVIRRLKDVYWISKTRGKKAGKKETKYYIEPYRTYTESVLVIEHSKCIALADFPC